jgi:hypothetical protein
VQILVNGNRVDGVNLARFVQKLEHMGAAEPLELLEKPDESRFLDDSFAPQSRLSTEAEEGTTTLDGDMARA